MFVFKRSISLVGKRLGPRTDHVYIMKTQKHYVLRDKNYSFIEKSFLTEKKPINARRIHNPIVGSCDLDRCSLRRAYKWCIMNDSLDAGFVTDLLGLLLEVF
jgi:hypothetical protein